MDCNDEQLMEAHLQGDDAAFGTLVNRYANALFGYLVRLTEHSQDAEDLFQETLLRIHTKAHTFKTGKRFKPWAFTIATNIANDRFRRIKRRGVVLTMDDPDRPIPETAFLDCEDTADINPVKNVIRTELQERVQDAIKTLPDRQRTALVLAYYQDLSYREVAEVMKCSVGTVKTHMSRATHKLADILPAPGSESV
jgi:RNA polymerase sigma-70 factor (ECF subfamily)